MTTFTHRATRQPSRPPRGAARCGALAVAVLLAVPRVAAASDVLWEWNDAALETVAAAKQLPAAQVRAMAMVNVAILEAVTAVGGRSAPGASGDGAAEAAAAAAGHGVLSALFPDRKAAWERLLEAALARIPDAAARERGVAAGGRAAISVVDRRSADGSGAPNAYRPVVSPGRYQPTALPAGWGWGQVTPWTMSAGDQFRPPPPPALDSATWRRDYEEVRGVGGKASARRTAEQTEAARFWIITGPGAQWPVIRALAATPGRTLARNARLLALASMAAADAYVAVFDAKYAYQFWRPITAIRSGGGLGEPTAADAIWEPLVDTPMHPEYPCAHCINAGAVAAVLEAEFGKGPLTGLAMTSPTAPGVTHRWPTIRAWEEEVSNARIWGGIHYRTSTEVGDRMGRQIGERTLRQHDARPTRRE